MDDLTWNPDQTRAKTEKASADAQVTPDYTDQQKLGGAELSTGVGATAKGAGVQQRKTKHGTGSEVEPEEGKDQSQTSQQPPPEKAAQSGLGQVMDALRELKDTLDGRNPQQPNGQSPQSPARQERGGYAPVADKLTSMEGMVKDLGAALAYAGVGQGQAGGNAPSTAGRGNAQHMQQKASEAVVGAGTPK